MKSSTNPITGDNLVSKAGNQDKYSEGWDAIWGKEEKLRSYSKPIILSNKIQCNKCKDIIESKHVHDFVTCSCGNISADGGLDYLRRVGDMNSYTDLSEITSEDEEDWFEKVRDNFTWGSRGKFSNEPLHYIKLKDMTTEHIMCILDTQWHIKNTHVEEYFKKELEYREVHNETKD